MAFPHAQTTAIEGVKVAVPRIEDYVVLKLLAAAADLRRRSRDLADVQYAIEAFPDHAGGILSVAGVRARLRDQYGITGAQLR